MIQRPQFKPHFEVQIIKGEGVFLVSEIGHSVLNGTLFELVAPLIDGRRSTDDIVDELETVTSAAEVYYALTLMEQRGYISDSDQTFVRGEAAFWSIQNITPSEVARRLAETPVSITTFGEIEVAPFLATLQSLHVRVADTGKLDVVVTDDYLRKELHAYNKDALRIERPWILIKPVGRQILIGPLFFPGQTGCWDCLAQRLRNNRAVEMFVQRKLNRDEPVRVPNAVTLASQQAAYNIAAIEIAKWIAQAEMSKAEAHVLSVDVLSWRSQLHALTRQPGCAACGNPFSFLEQPAKPVVLESRKKMFTEDGGHRVVAPLETLQKYEHHVSPITGAVSSLQRHLAADGLLHVYLAGENAGGQYFNLKHLKLGLRSSSAGKGTTDIQAKASGLCEALERYSAVFRGTETRRTAKLSELGEYGIHPNECMRFSERQYRERDTINAAETDFYFVPFAFDDEAKVEWTPVWSLTHKVERYLPTEYCYSAYPSAGRVYCVACSNGNAAGNTIEEAILQGFFELVERDSVAVWWYNRVPRPGVDMDSFNEPYFGKLRTLLISRGRDFWVLDLTTDLGIPAFAAISRRIDHVQEQIVFGFGAHLDARIAILRAVTELNQMLVWLLRPGQNGDDTLPSIEDSNTLNWLKTATVANQPYIAPDFGTSPRTARAYPPCLTDDLRDDVFFCQKLVEEHGMEMLVLDQTRADIGLPVVKVFVPGLRHFWARFAQGRLYDVPVTLGWLKTRHTEEQLNPVPSVSDSRRRFG